MGYDLKAAAPAYPFPCFVSEQDDGWVAFGIDGEYC